MQRAAPARYDPFGDTLFQLIYKVRYNNYKVINLHIDIILSIKFKQKFKLRIKN